MADTFIRTANMLEHRRRLSPGNLLFVIADDRFVHELSSLAEITSNEELLLVIRTLEYSMPETEQGDPVLLGKNVLRRAALIRADLMMHLAPVSVALSRVDAKHFGEWQSESILSAATHDYGLVTSLGRLRNELAAATWRGYERRREISENRINRARGHLVMKSVIGAVITNTPVDESAGLSSVLDKGISEQDYCWFGEHWEQIIALWAVLVKDRDFSRSHVEELIKEHEDASF